MKKSTIGKIAYISAITAAVILHVGCSNKPVESVVSVPTTTVSSTESTAISTTATAAEPTRETAEPLTEKEAYLRDLLGNSEPIIDDHASDGSYVRVVANDTSLNCYIELPQDSAENNCKIIDDKMNFFLRTGNENGFKSISFFFHDYDGQNVIMMYSATNRSGSWQGLTSPLWYDDEYERIWNAT